MRLMTLNLWNYQPPWDGRRRAIAHLIDDIQPDFLALQESRHDIRYHRGAGQAEQIAEETGYRVTSAVAQSYLPFGMVDEGLAVLSRTQPTGSEVCSLTLHPHLRADENHRICLAVFFQLVRTRLIVASTHFSLSPAARATNAQETAAFLDRISEGGPIVLMGDLNAEPRSPEIRFLVDEGGFNDLWVAGRDGESGFTYASFDPVRRIDYIMARNLSIEPLTVYLAGDAPVEGVFASDHMAIVADLPDP
jgi:endonuclease/exonuclease/phosphatase family metal-dependent hydrolase